MRRNTKDDLKQNVLDSDNISQTDEDEAQYAAGTEDQKENEKGYEGAIAHIFDWDKHFYSHLPKNNEQKKENDRMLEHILENSKWHDRMK